MMTTETISTPDLEEGISVSELPDGGRIVGHVGEESVLLIRKGDQYLAVDAFCTHYHAPLVDGLVVGDTIRCPWHHACFELRTGSAAGAPAMRPLRVFRTVRAGERIRVLPDPEPPHKPRPTGSGTEQIVIIGAGAAGSFAAAELRRVGFDGRVVLITRESRPPYDKPNLSKDYLAGRAPDDWIPLRGDTDYAQDGVDLRLRTTVDRIFPARREVRLGSGERIPFDRLILATGARPRHLDIPVAPDAHLYYLRTWPDAESLRAVAGVTREVVVIGASFIGLETAASLRERGLSVTVVAPEERPLERVLGRDVAEFILGTHESKGVKFRLGRKPVEIRHDSVVLDDGSSERCEIVVAGVGVVPETYLAERAGLAVDGGIVANAFLQTSSPNVFTAGDATRFPYARSGRSIRVEHWAAAARQGQVAARNAIGRREPFAAVPFFWSQHYDLVFAYVGHAESAADAQLFGSLSEGNAAVLYRDQGRVAAVATLFRDDVSLAVEAAMEREAPDEEIAALVSRAF